MTKKINPRTEALAFRVWAYASPREWQVTIREIADALDESTARISHLLTFKRWASRVTLQSRYSETQRPGVEQFHHVARDLNIVPDEAELTF